MDLIYTYKNVKIDVTSGYYLVIDRVIYNLIPVTPFDSYNYKII